MLTNIIVYHFYYDNDHTCEPACRKNFCNHTMYVNTWTWMSMPQSQPSFNTLRPRQNGRHLPNDIFKRIFLNQNVRISIKISLKFVPKSQINNNPSLVQIMAWRRSGDKPLSEPMMVSLVTHICVTRPQWIKEHSRNHADGSWWILPDGTKPLTETMLTYHQSIFVSFTWQWFYRMCSTYQFIKWVWKFHLWNYIPIF